MAGVRFRHSAEKTQIESYMKGDSDVFKSIDRNGFLGSVSHSVARYAETSVLLIPPLD